MECAKILPPFYNTTIFVFCQQLRAYFGCKAGKNKDVETSFDEAERHNARIFSFGCRVRRSGANAVLRSMAQISA